jgi:osmotically-inducible protein OsmY
VKHLLCVILLSAASVFASTRPVANAPRHSDIEIESAIKTKLAKSKIGKDGFQVHVKNGVATWTGSTAVMQHKGAATRMAKTAGATQVVNNIKVSDEAKSKASGNLAGPRKVQVKSAGQ